LLTSLDEEKHATVRSVAIDMWKPFAKAVRKHLPSADIVHDRFHISKYLNEAVDDVRRHESRKLSEI
jgi:transposase